MAWMVSRSVAAAPSRPRGESARRWLCFFFGGPPFWTKNSHPARFFIVRRNLRSTPSRGSFAIIRSPRRHDVPRSRLKLFANQGERDRECPRPAIINVVFENVFENSSNFIATVNRTIRSSFVIITFDSFPRDTRERRSALS